jgi:hypothetical protein
MEVGEPPSHEMSGHGHPWFGIEQEKTEITEDLGIDCGEATELILSPFLRLA